MTRSSRFVPAVLASVVLSSLVALLEAAPPEANAGLDQQGVVMHRPVALDGTGSSDPAGRPLTFAWQFGARPAGSAATLLNPTTANPSFIPDRNGTYQILLTVQAGLETATDTVVVVTQNHPPVANAGADSGAQIGKKFTLVGVGTDPDLDKLTFAWTLLSRPDSSLASFGTPRKAATTLTLDRPGTYVAEFRVTDPFGLFATDTVEISHVNSAPIANAGPAQSAPVGTIVVLDASASSDVDEDPLTYTWSLATPKRSAAVLSDPTALQPTFTVDVAGTYRATLVAKERTTFRRVRRPAAFSSQASVVS